jgi:hypothetical protein
MLSLLKRLLSRVLLGSTDRAARIALDANARLAMPPRTLEAGLCVPSSSSENDPAARRASLVVIEGGLARGAHDNGPPSRRPRSGNRFRRAV